jgi:CheY-like chemotaxis protein
MKILVADDYFSNRLLIREVLNDLGHALVEAENGKQACEALLSNDDIDLVLMDIEMPVMSGLQAMRTIRETFPAPKNQVPIVALTAHNSMVLMDDPHFEGFNGILVKPYSISRISELLESFRR